MTDLLRFLPQLPGEQLNEDQAWGFRLACSCMMTVGRQMEDAPTLSGTPSFLQEGGRMMRTMAAGLAVTIGCPD